MPPNELPTPTYSRTRDFGHPRALADDLEAVVTFVDSEGLPVPDSARADVDSLRALDASNAGTADQIVTDALVAWRELDLESYGLAALFAQKGMTSLSAAAEVDTSRVPRARLRELKWSADDLHPAYADAAVEPDPARAARLDAAIDLWWDAVAPHRPRLAAMYTARTPDTDIALLRIAQVLGSTKAPTLETYAEVESILAELSIYPEVPWSARTDATVSFWEATKEEVKAERG